MQGPHIDALASLLSNIDFRFRWVNLYIPSNHGSRRGTSSVSAQSGPVFALLLLYGHVVFFAPLLRFKLNSHYNIACLLFIFKGQYQQAQSKLPLDSIGQTYNQVRSCVQQHNMYNITTQYNNI